MKRIGALALSIWMLLSPLCGALAATLGPATTYEELLSLAASAAAGDTLLVSGVLSADQPFSPPVYLYLSGEEGASISGLHIENAQLVLSSLSLTDSLRVSGASHLQLMRGVSVSGGLSFSGSGSLLLDRGATVVGSPGAPGVSVRHTGGDLYVSLDGTVRGGDGETGGAAAEFDPMLASGALMVTGTLTGGKGEAFGGNAVNLHNLSSNAFITVDGTLTGGEGNIGGSGLQLITATGAVAAGLGGRITGGRGDSYGGDAMLLMNVGDSSIVSLSGVLTGGDSSGTDSTPGQSLKLLGRTTAMRTSVGNCILQDGKQVLYTISVTPLPAIKTPVVEAEQLEPTPVPPPAATIEPTQTPTPEPTPTSEPTPEPTLEPTAEPTEEPTLEPTVEPTFAPPPAPTGDPAGDPTFAPTAEPSQAPTQVPSLPDEPTFEPTDGPVATDGEAA